MDETRMRQIAEQVYAQRATQYGIAKVPVHVHNGQDTTRIDFTDLNNSGWYRAITQYTLTPTQIKALHTAPAQIISSAGPNAIIIVEGIEAYLAYNGTAYTGANDITIRYRDTINSSVSFAIPVAFLNLTQSGYIHIAGVADTYIEMDAGGSVEAFVATANPAAGNSPLYLQLTYRIVNLIN